MEYRGLAQRVRNECELLHIFDADPPTHGLVYSLERYWDGSTGEGKDKPKYVFGYHGKEKHFYVEIWAINTVWPQYPTEYNRLKSEDSLQINTHDGKSTSFWKKINFVESEIDYQQISLEVVQFIQFCESIIQRTFFKY